MGAIGLSHLLHHPDLHAPPAGCHTFRTLGRRRQPSRATPHPCSGQCPAAAWFPQALSTFWPCCLLLRAWRAVGLPPPMHCPCTESCGMLTNPLQPYNGWLHTCALGGQPPVPPVTTCTTHSLRTPTFATSAACSSPAALAALDLSMRHRQRLMASW